MPPPRHSDQFNLPQITKGSDWVVFITWRLAQLFSTFDLELWLDGKSFFLLKNLINVQYAIERTSNFDGACLVQRCGGEFSCLNFDAFVDTLLLDPMPDKGLEITQDPMWWDWAQWHIIIILVVENHHVLFYSTRLLSLIYAVERLCDRGIRRGNRQKYVQ